MEREITADGTDVFFLRAGRYIVAFSGTAGGSTNVYLQAGGSSDSANHVQETTPAGDDFGIVAGVFPEPQELRGGTYFSLVTTSFSGSSDLVAHFRYVGD